MYIDFRIYTTDLNFGFSSKDLAYALIWKGMLRESFREKNFMAELSGIRGEFDVSFEWLQFEFKSYNDKIEVYLKDIFEKIGLDTLS